MQYNLDHNHNPNYKIVQNVCDIKLKSGSESVDILANIDRFFCDYFGACSSSFFDFSPYSVYLLLKACNSKIAVSKKLSHFLYEGAILAQSMGIDIVWVDVASDGTLCEQSLKNAKNSNAEYLFLAVVDEDIYTVEDMTKINKYYTNDKLILDISNSQNIKIPQNTKAMLLWGYKLGGNKNSGVLLHDFDKLLWIDRLDMYEYDKLKILLSTQSIQDQTAQKELFVSLLSTKIADGYRLLLPLNATIHNSFCIVLSGIKARDLIRALAIDGISITNGEYCSLGLSKPSRIHSLLYDKNYEIISISFDTLNNSDIEYLSSKIALRYMQIRAIIDC